MLPSTGLLGSVRPVLPAGAKILFVGEAPGETEEFVGIPLVGESGKEFDRMLADAGIVRAAVGLTNVLNRRPGRIFLDRFPDSLLPTKQWNDIELICGSKADEGAAEFGPLRPAKYLWAAEATRALARLKFEIEQIKPNLIIALGNTALWALCGLDKITRYRGTVLPGSLVPGIKVLPTFHPAHVLRNWHLRVIVVADLVKARLEAEFSDIRRPRRAIWVDPTLEDLDAFANLYFEPFRHRPRDLILSVDVETFRGRITCIGFAPSPAVAICVPFIDWRTNDLSYWHTLADEIRARQWCKGVLEHGFSLLGQNFIYDIQYFLNEGIEPKHYIFDTMVEHHALFPEMEKSLGFLGSVYTSEPAWKMMRPKGHKMEKLEE